MNEFIEKNRRFLKFCSEMACFYGVLSLIAVGAVVAILVVGVISGSSNVEMLRKVLPPQTLLLIPTMAFHGFVALIVAEFISYLLAGEGEPKRILRHGDKIIYAYVLFNIVMYIRVFFYMSTTSELASRLGPDVFMVLTVAAKVFMWIGIGITLKKILPIIKESKLLV